MPNLREDINDFLVCWHALYQQNDQQFDGLFRDLAIAIETIKNPQNQEACGFEKVSEIT